MLSKMNDADWDDYCQMLHHPWVVFHPTRGLVIFEESKVVMFKSKKECDLFISTCEWIDGEISQRLSPMGIKAIQVEGYNVELCERGAK